MARRARDSFAPSAQGASLGRLLAAVPNDGEAAQRFRGSGDVTGRLRRADGGFVSRDRLVQMALPVVRPSDLGKKTRLAERDDVADAVASLPVRFHGQAPLTH